jgi:hypothetical protein
MRWSSTLKEMQLEAGPSAWGAPSSSDSWKQQHKQVILISKETRLPFCLFPLVAKGGIGNETVIDDEPSSSGLCASLSSIQLPLLLSIQQVPFVRTTQRPVLKPSSSLVSIWSRPSVLYSSNRLEVHGEHRRHLATAWWAAQPPTIGIFRSLRYRMKVVSFSSTSLTQS